MGWASGSSVMGDIIAVVQEEIKDKDVRKRLYIGIIRALEMEDWDTQDECMGVDGAFDEAMWFLHPSYRHDYYDGEYDE